jgi:hypothetical protein
VEVTGGEEEGRRCDRHCGETLDRIRSRTEEQIL